MEDDFDLVWRFWAVKLATMEQLDIKGRIETDKLFSRAKDIFDKGYEHKLDQWKTMWKKQEEEVVLGGSEEKPAKPGYKQCPKCKENIPNTWPKHAYQKNGNKCGHVFKGGLKIEKQER